MAATTRNKEVHIDFTKEPYAPQFAQATHAIATAADNQVDFCRVGGDKYIEWIQTGASTALMFEPQATAPFGWLMPVDLTDGDGLEITTGINAQWSPAFTVGTDEAFYVRARFVCTTLANSDVLGVGFRKLGAYVDITTPALMGSVYDDKYAISVDDGAGAIVSHHSVGGSDTQTTATGTPIVTAQAFEFEVRVSAAGICSGRIALDAATTPITDATAEDVLLGAAAAAARTITTGIVLVPYVTIVATGTAPDVVWQEFHCGYVNE